VRKTAIILVTLSLFAAVAHVGPAAAPVTAPAREPHPPVLRRAAVFRAPDSVIWTFAWDESAAAEAGALARGLQIRQERRLQDEGGEDVSPAAPAEAVNGPPRPAPAPLASETLVALLAAYFAPADVERALRIAWCESRYDVNATNPWSGAMGLFQHMPQYWVDRSAAAGWAGASAYDPEANGAVAAWLAYSDGWRHWKASAACW